MEKRLNYLYTVYHIDLCDESGANPRCEYSDIVILLPQHLHQDRIAHRLFLTRSGSCGSSAGTICKGLGEEASVFIGDYCPNLDQYMGRSHGRVACTGFRPPIHKLIMVEDISGCWDCAICKYSGQRPGLVACGITYMVEH